MYVVNNKSTQGHNAGTAYESLEIDEMIMKF